MRVHDGQIVAYAGDEGHDDLFIGDRGKVLVADGGFAHVLWSTGSRTGDVTITSTDALSGGSNDISVSSALDDSLEVGGLVAFSSRTVVDERGMSGLLDIVVESGHMSGFLDIAEEALGIVAHRIRHDASIRAITAELEDDEAEAFVRKAAALLIHDAFAIDEEQD